MMIRPLVLLWGLCAFAQPLFALEIQSDGSPPDSPFVLWMDKPAPRLDKARVPITADDTDSTLAREARHLDFHHALPIGNGRLGAMDFGGVELLRIALNESGVWSGGPYEWNQSDAWKHLPDIRKLVFEDRVEEAYRLVEEHFVWAKGTKRFEPTQFGAYQTLGDLLVSFPASDTAVSTYRRELDVMTGVTTTRYVRDGITHTRHLAASKPAEVIVLVLVADQPESLEFTATLARPAQATLRHTAHGLRLEGQLTFDWPGGVGTRFAGLLDVVVDGGSVKRGDDGIHVKGANRATLLVSCGSSLADPKAWEKNLVSRLLEAKQKTGDALITEAAADHRALMDRCILEFPDTPLPTEPLRARIQRAEKESDPWLDALYFQFGRHLLISASREDSPLPANLQGIWAEEIKPPWNADFHSNINLQMNYWAACPTNLAECNLPLMRLIRTTAKAGESTAKSYYNAPGWLCHHTQNPWGYSAPSNAHAGSGSTCGAWLCWHIWNHYLHTRDESFLREYLPILTGSAEFFLSTLVEDPASGALVTCPSNSPENAYTLPHPDSGNDQKMTLTYGATYDMQILRSLFADTAAALRVTGGDEALARRLDETRAKLSPTRLGSDGRILEWIREFKENQPQHRHVSHLWGLHPGNEIHPGTPDLYRGARATLEKRGDASTGWSMAWKSNFWARLGDGARSHKLYRMLISRGAPNLFCLHPPFQIDGNYGGTSAIAEMIVQCQSTDATGRRVIRVLPALPPSWPKGHVAGMRIRGGHTIQLHWDKQTAKHLTIIGGQDETVRIHHDNTIREIPLAKGVTQTIDF